MGEDREPTAPAAADRDPVAVLEARLGFALPDRSTALAALTHKSFVNEHREERLSDNERLEFLGDAVIDLAVSHRLMERFPEAREGELSKMRAAVVDEQGLSEMAKALDLGALLRLGRGEELTGGRSKASLLADAMEAVVAAVYLAGGLPHVLGLIDRFLGDAFARAAAGTLDRDYKTQLQELSQSRLKSTPRYRVVAEHGPDHSKLFEVETDLRGEVVGKGAGRSKKDAEQAAAKLALEALGRRFAEEITAAGASADVAGGQASRTPAPVETAPAGAPEPEVVAATASGEPELAAAVPAGVSGSEEPARPPRSKPERRGVRPAGRSRAGTARKKRAAAARPSGARKGTRPRGR